ncbi:MAG: lipid-A-disaccharide synthase [Thermoguttaceae bacterium]|jgi:lipid-A-disaccharide synthase
MAAERPEIFFSVGEPSGDVHGANLIRALRAQSAGLKAVGYGGPKMAEAGCQLHVDLTRLAVMWFARAVAHLPEFWRLVRRADRYFRDRRPDAVVLLDYPGFNWWIARRAKARGIPVFYYTPPQIWAWASWRVQKMRRFVDHVLCSLPFEEAWFQERGCNATFVGHPFFDEVGREPLDEAFLTRQRAAPGRLVTILPGSRTQEVTHNLPWFLKAASLIHQALPETRFAVASFKPQQAEMARRLVAKLERKPSAPPVEVFCGKTPELMYLAECCMACSGSVSLELLYYAKPTVILYRIGRTAYFVQGLFRKVQYITLVNLLAGGGLLAADPNAEDTKQPDAEKVLFPEYLTCADKSAEIARHIVEWLGDAAKREARIAALTELKARVGHRGASRRAAEYILQRLQADPAPFLVSPSEPSPC